MADALTDRELQSLRNMGNESERAADEIERLRAEAEKLRTVMVAAAEEIDAHWQAHCDADGYGPVNLQRRLEEGIPSEYGYTAGAFAKLKAETEALRAALAAQQAPADLPHQHEGDTALAVGNLIYALESWKGSPSKNSRPAWDALVLACRELVEAAAPAQQAPQAEPVTQPVLDWPQMLLLLNAYASHVADAAQHQSASRADISHAAALKALTDIRMALAAHASRWQALVHELIWRAAPAAPAGWQKPGPVTADHPLECLIVVKAVRQSDGDWWIGGSTFLNDDTPIGWMPHTAANRAALEPKE